MKHDYNKVCQLPDDEYWKLVGKDAAGVTDEQLELFIEKNKKHLQDNWKNNWDFADGYGGFCKECERPFFWFTALRKANYAVCLYCRNCHNAGNPIDANIPTNDEEWDRIINTYRMLDSFKYYENLEDISIQPKDFKKEGVEKNLKFE